MTNVVDSEFSQGAIKGREVRGRLNLDDRNLDGFGSECAETFAQFAGLVRSARDENAAASERQRIHQAAPPGMLLPSESNAPAPSASSISAASRPSAKGSVFWRGACR